MTRRPSRWTQWVVTASADPHIPLAWTLIGPRRQRRRAPADPAFA
jgi:hypothetical protein